MVESMVEELPGCVAKEELKFAVVKIVARTQGRNFRPLALLRNLKGYVPPQPHVISFLT